MYTYFILKCNYLASHIHLRAFNEYLLNYVLYILGKIIGMFCINTAINIYHTGYTIYMYIINGEKDFYSVLFSTASLSMFDL